MNDENQSDQAPTEQDDPAGLRKALEAQKAQIAELSAYKAETERREAFRSAGIPEGDEGSVWDLFRKSYDGELTAEAISAARDRLGIPAPSQQEEPQVTSQPESSDLDPNEAAALASMSNMRAEFSAPAESVGQALIDQMMNASSADEMFRIATQAGVPLSQD